MPSLIPAQQVPRGPPARREYRARLRRHYPAVLSLTSPTSAWTTDPSWPVEEIASPPAPAARPTTNEMANAPSSEASPRSGIQSLSARPSRCPARFDRSQAPTVEHRLAADGRSLPPAPPTGEQRRNHQENESRDDRRDRPVEYWAFPDDRLKHDPCPGLGWSAGDVSAPVPRRPAHCPPSRRWSLAAPYHPMPDPGGRRQRESAVRCCVGRRHPAQHANNIVMRRLTRLPIPLAQMTLTGSWEMVL